LSKNCLKYNFSKKFIWVPLQTHFQSAKCSKVKTLLFICFTNQTNYTITFISFTNYSHFFTSHVILILLTNSLISIFSYAMNRLKHGWRYLSKSNINNLLDSHPNVLQTKRFGTEAHQQLNRDFFVKLWVSDGKTQNPRARKSIKCRGLDLDPRWFSASPVHAATAAAVTSKPKPVLKQPPISQSVSEFSKPESPEEVKFVSSVICFFLFYIIDMLYIDVEF